MIGKGRKSVTLAAALVVIGAVAAGTAASAQAWTCASNTLCFYDGYNGGSASLTMYAPTQVPNMHVGGWGDRVNSYWNRTSHRYCVYTNIDYRGLGLTVPPGGLGNFPVSWVNTISSLRRC